MHRSTPNRRVGRRTFVRGAAAAVGGYALATSPMARAFSMTGREIVAAGLGGDGRPRVYTLVLDGLRTDEITPERMPNLVSLIADGSSYSSARAAMVAETLPNHVAMATGAAPGTHGVVANDIYDPSLEGERRASKPGDIGVETIFGTLRGAGLTAATVVSKRYLYDVFAGAADHHWDPEPEIPESEHAPDVFTMEKVHEFVDGHDPDFLFANLGDIDRSGHVDETGPTGFPAFRTAVLQNTDRLLGDFVGFLQSSDRWEASTILITADHSMDWSIPTSTIQLGPALDEDPSLEGNYVLVDNGGAELVYWTGQPAGRAEGVARMRAIIAEVEGVESVHGTGEVGLGPKAGDLVAYCEPGWRFTDPRFDENPIPGNHGHPVTQPIPFVVTGGAEFVRRDVTVDGVTAHTVDVAPTVAWLFGVEGALTAAETASRYEGTPLVDAFGDLGRTVEAPAGEGESLPDTTGTTVPAEVLGETVERGAPPARAAPSEEPLPATGGGAVAGAAGVALGGAALTFRQILTRARESVARSASESREAR